MLTILTTGSFYLAYKLSICLSIGFPGYITYFRKGLILDFKLCQFNPLHSIVDLFATFEFNINFWRIVVQRVKIRINFGLQLIMKQSCKFATIVIILYR